MKFHEIKSEALNLITAYSDSSVSIGNKIINRSSIIFPDSVIENIDLQKVSDFNGRNIKKIYDLSPEIILIGSVGDEKITKPDQFKKFYNKNISVEVMNLHAACRTFNILISEQRNVALILIFQL
jgi:uncharacterized protein